MGDDLPVVEDTPDDFDPVTSIDNLSRKPVGFLGWVKRIALWMVPVAVGIALGWSLAQFS